MADFDITYIDIFLSSDNWGPYEFNIPTSSGPTASDGAIPYGTIISDVSVAVYLGDVSTDSDLASETALTGVVDPDYPIVIGSNSVKLSFTHPGVSYIGEKATIIFTLTLSNGAVRPFFFKYLVFN